MFSNNSKNNISASAIIEKSFLILKKIIRKLTRYIYYKDKYLILEAPLKARALNLESIGFHASDNNPEFMHQVKMQFPHKYKLFNKRLKQNLHCLRVYSDQNILVAYSWSATTDYFEPLWKYTFRLKPKQIYQLDAFVKPEYRKSLQGMFITAYMSHNYFIKRGITSSIIAVDKSNKRLLKFYSFLGYKEIGEKLVIRYIFRVSFSVSKPYSERYMKVRESKKPAEA